jgi:hypothetical protein
MMVPRAAHGEVHHQAPGGRTKPQGRRVSMQQDGRIAERPTHECREVRQDGLIANLDPRPYLDPRPFQSSRRVGVTQLCFTQSQPRAWKQPIIPPTSTAAGHRRRRARRPSPPRGADRTTTRQGKTGFSRSKIFSVSSSTRQRPPLKHTRSTRRAQTTRPHALVVRMSRVDASPIRCQVHGLMGWCLKHSWIECTRVAYPPRPRHGCASRRTWPPASPPPACRSTRS